MSHSNDEWRAVKTAVENALPFYESISEAISLGLAGPLRRRAIRRLEHVRNDWILDSGSGPGVSSRMLVDDGFEHVIGLDPSMILLRFTKSRLKDRFYPVQAVAENLPLRARSVLGALTCYSLRDVRDREQSIREFARVVKEDGRLEIVDVGKPDGLFFQMLVGLYVALVMPVVARSLIGRRRHGNPFRMIIPTFHRLPTNRKLTRVTGRLFGAAVLREFLFGGLIIVEAARKSDRLSARSAGRLIFQGDDYSPGNG